MDNNDKIILNIDANLFEVFWEVYGKNISLKKEFVKKIFLMVDIKYKKFISETSISSIVLKNLNVYDIAYYVCEEHSFNIRFIPKEKIEGLENDDNYINDLVKMVYDKLVYNDYDNLNGLALRSKYSVEISTLNMFVNRLFTLIKPITISNTKDKLLVDIFVKCFLLLKSTLTQLTSAIETEALSSWRTLHELECVLKIIYDANEDVAKAYFRHLEYGAYHRNEINDQNEIDRIVKNLEADMESLQVKKNNKEKFINYGWLHWISKRHNDEEIKFNFLGGLQKLANLTNYKKWYEIASDVTHSTPLLVYANRRFIYHSTLCITYESFFRIETLFFNFVLSKLGEQNSVLMNYFTFKQTYKNKIEFIYSILKRDQDPKKSN